MPAFRFFLPLLLAVSTALAANPAGQAQQGQVPPPPFAKGQPDPAFQPQPDRHTLFGMSWGDPVPAGMKQEDVKTPPGVSFYKRTSDALNVDGVPVEAIHYVFENGGLSGFSIQVSASKKDAFSAALTKRWGPPTVRPNGGQVWVTPGAMAAFAPLGPPHEGSLVLSVFAR